VKYLKFSVLLIVFMLFGCTTDKLKDIQDDLLIQYSESDHKDSVTSDLQIPTKIDGIEISWSSDSEFATVSGNSIIINRQSEDITVKLTASFEFNGKTYSEAFTILVKATEGEEFDLEQFKNALGVPQTISEDLTLVSSYLDNTVTWVSSNESVISNLGKVVQQSVDTTVTLTASITIDGETKEVSFEVLVTKSEPSLPDFESLLAEISLPTETTMNLTLPASLEGYQLTWESNHQAVSSTGFVTRQSEDVTVLLTVAVSDHPSFTRTYEIKVLKKDVFPESGYSPISEVRLSTLGTKVTIQGVVTSLMSNGNFTIQDSTGAIPVYMRNNTGLQVGTEYVIEGTLDAYQGLIQIATPTIVQTLGERALPEGIDLTGYSLEFDDVILYEANIASYLDLEVTSKETPNNAIELYLRNSAGETTFVRLDTRVNTTYTAFDAVQVGEIVNLYNITVGQYASKAQFLFTSRSLIESRPKSPEIISIYGAENRNYIMGEALPNYLEGITAKNGFNEDFTNLLVVDTTEVNLDEPGNYTVKVSLSNDASIIVTYTLFVRKEIETGVFEGYYQSLDGLVGNDLNNALRTLIRNTGGATGSTSQVKSVDKVGNSYYLIYEDMGSYGNREHVWPQSKLGSVKDDLHNLRAARVSTNSSRSNYPFTEDNKPFTGSQPYQKIGSAWYPGDEHIGDVARIVLYISVRYNLSLSAVGNLDMFLEWHSLDPVNDFERTRNDRIFGIQDNRNPFIDHPELVDIYFGGASTSFDSTIALISSTIFMASDNRQYLY